MSNYPKIKRPGYCPRPDYYQEEGPMGAFAAWTRRYWPHLLLAGALFLVVALAGWGR